VPQPDAWQSRNGCCHHSYATARAGQRATSTNCQSVTSGWAEPEVIAHSWGDIETCSVIQVRFRSLVLENILEMVSAEGSAIFPLGVANTIAFADRQPVVFANRAARFGYRQS
jgi:hypothetical protein